MENSARLFLYPTGGSDMPSKPKRPCSYPNCPNLTDGRFCEEHQRVVNKHYEKYIIKSLYLKEVRMTLKI